MSAICSCKWQLGQASYIEVTSSWQFTDQMFVCFGENYKGGLLFKDIPLVKGKDCKTYLNVDQEVSSSIKFDAHYGYFLDATFGHL